MKNKLRSYLAVKSVVTVLCCVLLAIGISWLVNRHIINPQAKTALTAMALGQYGVAKDFYLSEAAKGNPAAQNALANLYYLGLGGQRNIALATDLYFKSASQGYAPAQVNLGNLFSQGLGVPADALRAFAWYQMSNISGSPVAEIYLTQIAVEFTLSPLQISTTSSQWPTLASLVAAGLD